MFIRVYTYQEATYLFTYECDQIPRLEDVIGKNNVLYRVKEVGWEIEEETCKVAKVFVILLSSPYF